ncbi:hypothetical protein N0B31_18420 [Salinirubellus salinus]|uniref:Lipoprotein n=1 Tax=Salinirubellus salinus TaxID=1364945 RepID=A0A9E7R1M3_9EURY|nr:hypothetical protein [Salinirubellus salinus]UWM54081.1 hypothetical protein N0B31_18420 [Salinirubellus salinus]
MPALRRTLPLVLLLVAVSAGCLGGPLGGGSPTPTDSPSPSPTQTATPVTDLTGEPVTFPDGPKERPERPPTLNESSVREYVRAFEYRYAYNALWVNERSQVTLECEVDAVNETAYGYEALVTCSGYSGPDESYTGNGTDTPTPVPHADWFTQTYRYRVDSDTTLRERVSMAE